MNSLLGVPHMTAVLSRHHWWLFTKKWSRFHPVALESEDPDPRTLIANLDADGSKDADQCMFVPGTLIYKRTIFDKIIQREKRLRKFGKNKK